MPKTLEERLDAHPRLKVQLLDLLELAESDIERADEVEERTVESVRSAGRQVIQDWAEQQEQKISQSVWDAVDHQLELKGKKLYWTTTYGEIASYVVTGSDGQRWGPRWGLVPGRRWWRSCCWYAPISKTERY